MRLTEEDMKKNGSSDLPEEAEESVEEKLRHRESFSQKERIRMDRQVFSSLDTGGKIQYLIDYYKWVPVALAALVLVISVVATSVRNAKKVTLFQAILVDTVAMENITADSDGTTRLQEDLKAIMGPDDPNSAVIIDTSYYTANGALSYDSSMMESVRMAAGELDVEIIPKFLYDFYSGTSVSEDAASVFADSEEYESQEEEILYGERKITDRYMPVSALMGEEFAAKYSDLILDGGCGILLGTDNAGLAGYDIYGKKADEPMVLAICVNAPHPEQVAAFIRFMGFE